MASDLLSIGGLVKRTICGAPTAPTRRVRISVALAGHTSLINWTSADTAASAASMLLFATARGILILEYKGLNIEKVSPLKGGH